MTNTAIFNIENLQRGSLKGLLGRRSPEEFRDVQRSLVCHSSSIGEAQKQGQDTVHLSVLLEGVLWPVCSVDVLNVAVLVTVGIFLVVYSSIDPIKYTLAFFPHFVLQQVMSPGVCSLSVL